MSEAHFRLWCKIYRHDLKILFNIFKREFKGAFAISKDWNSFELFNLFCNHIYFESSKQIYSYDKRTYIQQRLYERG